MSDDYLWDGSGEPDPEVRRLELLLGGIRSDRKTSEIQARFEEYQRHRLRKAWLQLAAAASVFLVLAVSWFVLRQTRGEWVVESLAGAPKVGSNRIVETGRLGVGQWLETDSSSRARIDVGSIGHVEVEPNTRIRLVRARLTEHRLALARGIMHAKIFAPPRIFFVDTPSAVAVDLGCAYTMEVDDLGAGMLRVTMGWVQLELNGRESMVPKGARCQTRPGLGPGTPYFEDASESFRAALAKLDFENGGTDALRTVLLESRKRDTLTLWHVLSRARDAERGVVYERMASLVPPPKNVTRDGVMDLDKNMLELWKEELEWAW